MSSVEYINSTILTAPAFNVTFSGIPNVYRDILLTANVGLDTDTNFYFRVGSGSIDAGGNYSSVTLRGNGGSATSSRSATDTHLISGSNQVVASGNRNIIQINILSYSNTTQNKIILSELSSPLSVASVDVGIWKSNSSIDTIRFLANANISSGSSFTLWGVK